MPALKISQQLRFRNQSFLNWSYSPYLVSAQIMTGMIPVIICAEYVVEFYV